MTDPAAADERFIAVSPPHMSIREIAITLKERMPEAAKKTPTRKLPDFLLRVIALFDAEVAQIAKQLGQNMNSTNEKTRRVLGWEPRGKEDAIVATAESLMKLGLLEK
jgi:dihydroflavonol-4-reductase